MKKEYTFEELGYFAERECQALKDYLLSELLRIRTL